MNIVNHPAGTRYFSTQLDSPVGRLRLIASDAGLAAILWENDNPRRVGLPATAEQPEHPVLLAAARQLREYFAGRRRVFDLPLDFVGTDFQRKVWAALLTIPYGETRSYSDIARQIGLPTAVRAVGAATGRTPVSIVTPCHRVIGASGQRTGFAGGLAVKARLLALESPQAQLRSVRSTRSSPAASGLYADEPAQAPPAPCV